MKEVAMAEAQQGAKVSYAAWQEKTACAFTALVPLLYPHDGVLGDKPHCSPPSKIPPP